MGDDGEREPRDEPDPFAGLVLDEDFVRGATRSEPPAAQRAPLRVARPASPPAPPAPERRRPARGIDAARQSLAVPLVVVVLVLVAAVLLAKGPLAPGSGLRQALHIPTAASPKPPATTNPLPPAAAIRPDATTTTGLTLAQQSYQPGDCLTWDESRPVQVPSTAVPCTAPHLIEITRQERLPYSSAVPYPGEADWRSIEDAVCAPDASAYLGYPLDYYGRFAVGAIRPVAAGWTEGDRTVWCGIQLRQPSLADPTLSQLAPFTGAVRGQDQTYLYPIGSCLGTDAQGLPATVDCGTPHTAEVTGTVDLSGRASQLPAGTDQWQALVGQPCLDQAVAYHGGTLPPGMRSGWLPIEPSSWEAGRRTVQCTVGWFDSAGSPLAQQGTLRG